MSFRFKERHCNDLNSNLHCLQCTVDDCPPKFIVFEKKSAESVHNIAIDASEFFNGEGGKIWENGIETCEMSCIKRYASPGSMHDAGCLGLVHWDDPEGW